MISDRPAKDDHDHSIAEFISALKREDPPVGAEIMAADYGSLPSALASCIGEPST
jgi:hypothetical protein